jgi:hypothetical protein
MTLKHHAYLTVTEQRAHSPVLSFRGYGNNITYLISRQFGWRACLDIYRNRLQIAKVNILLTLLCVLYHSCFLSSAVYILLTKVPSLH